MATSVNDYIQDLIDRIISDVERSDQRPSLVSVILTGSLGRDEGTFHVNQDTLKVVLDSDVELALVYKRGGKKDAEKIKEMLIKNYQEDMNPMTISEDRVRNGYNFNYSFLPPKYSSIFMYDFYNGSKTILGEDLLIRKVAPYDKYEAKRIVANRIGELTCVQKDKSENKDKLIRQWKCKLVLAIGSAYCILKDAYKSKYEDQYNYLASHKKELEDVFGEHFFNDYQRSFLFLRKSGDAHDISFKNLAEYVKQAKLLFEKKKLDHPQINSMSRRMKYAIACIRSKSDFNPLDCEETIIDELIDEFIDRDDDLFDVAESWKKILY